MGGGMGFGLESISLESISILESSKTALTDNRDALMLSTAAESLKARPERLIARSQKFYTINAFNTVSALRKIEQVRKEIEEINVKKLLESLDEIWLNGDLDEHMTEDEYMEFRKSIEYSLPLKAY